MSEHWLYLPSIGFFLLAAKAICVGARRAVPLHKTLTAIFTACLLTFYAATTIRQNGFWSEPIGFYERTLKYAPDSSRVHSNLGVEYFALNKNEEAIDSYKNAIEIEADGFLYNMVRRIVGVLLEVGRGKLSENDVKRMLETGKGVGGPTTPAHALYLVEVKY